MKKNKKNIQELKLKKNAAIIEFGSTKKFLNGKFLVCGIAECFREDDYKMVYDIALIKD